MDGRHEKLEESVVVGINAGAGKAHIGGQHPMTLNWQGFTNKNIID